MSPFPSVASALPKLKRFLKLPEHHGLALLSCNGTASDSDSNDEDAMLSRTTVPLRPTAEMLRAHGIKRKPFGIHDRTPRVWT